MAATLPPASYQRRNRINRTSDLKTNLLFFSGAFGLVCSAKDQLGGTAVAIKKIMKPFSTPVLSKRTYRELKLLKHLRHENVSVGKQTRWHARLGKLII
jgi:serine/threonine protein kinase